jgi:hypothetical protein
MAKCETCGNDYDKAFEINPYDLLAARKPPSDRRLDNIEPAASVRFKNLLPGTRSKKNNGSRTKKPQGSFETDRNQHIRISLRNGRSWLRHRFCYRRRLCTKRSFLIPDYSNCQALTDWSKISCPAGIHMWECVLRRSKLFASS